VAAWIAASASRAARQPWPATSQPVSGRKIELANPATTVTASSAPGRRAGSVHETITAKAASYRLAAAAAPIAICTA
jgi:hypothetical protein